MRSSIVSLLSTELDAAELDIAAEDCCRVDTLVESDTIGKACWHGFPLAALAALVSRASCLFGALVGDLGMRE